MGATRTNYPELNYIFYLLRSMVFLVASTLEGLWSNEMDKDGVYYWTSFGRCDVNDNDELVFEL